MNGTRQWHTEGAADAYPDRKIHGANVGPTWGSQDPGGPHVGHMNLAIWVYMEEDWVIIESSNGLSPGTKPLSKLMPIVNWILTNKV